MPLNARYAHTNIVALDWRKLADFYIEVLGCTPVLPERHLDGGWLDRLTGIENSRIDGIHLRLPGHGENGPTLEIFQYSSAPGETGKDIDLPGFAHIAFAVEDVETALETVKAAGGSAVGELVRTRIGEAGTVTLVDARDPEGNIIELQHWK